MNSRKILLIYFLILAALAVSTYFVMFGGAHTPRAERLQKDLARVLPSLYQKYYIDNKRWPETPIEAAIHFRSENPVVLERVKAAVKDWDLTTDLLKPTEPSSLLEVRFSRPSPRKLTFVVEKKRS